MHQSDARLDEGRAEHRGERNVDRAGVEEDAELPDDQRPARLEEGTVPPEQLHDLVEHLCVSVCAVKCVGVR